MHRETKVFNSRSKRAVSETSFQIAPFFIFMFLLFFFFFPSCSSRPHASSSWHALFRHSHWHESSLAPLLARVHTHRLIISVPVPSACSYLQRQNHTQSVSQSVSQSGSWLCIYSHASVAHQHCPKRLDSLQTLTRWDEQLCARAQGSTAEKNHLPNSLIQHNVCSDVVGLLK